MLFAVFRCIKLRKVLIEDVCRCVSYILLLFLLVGMQEKGYNEFFLVVFGVKGAVTAVWEGGGWW